MIPEGKRKYELCQAATLIFGEDFVKRILPFDESAAVAFANISAQRRGSGVIPSLRIFGIDAGGLVVID